MISTFVKQSIKYHFLLFVLQFVFVYTIVNHNRIKSKIQKQLIKQFKKKNFVFIEEKIQKYALIMSL